MKQSRLDAIDIEILACLQQNGKMKNVVLAERVALSPSPCLQRVKRLEKLGFIKSYQAEIAFDNWLETIQVLTQFHLGEDTAESHLAFQNTIIHYDEVLNCFLGSGGFDYQVRFMCRDLSHYQAVVQDILNSDLNISKYHSYVVMKEIISRPQVPLRALIK